MAFEDAFPLFHQGPLSDLTIAYLSTVINGATVTNTAGKTSRGFSLTRSTNGVYSVVFPKCKFCSIVPIFKPVNAAGGRAVRVLAGTSPTAGTATVEISTDGTVNGAAADPAAAANELELVFLLGF